MFKRTLALVLTLVATIAYADDETTKAAVGGGLGGAVGAVVGQELGDREGAIVGSAIGAAIGTAVATDKEATDKSDAEIGVHVQASVPAHPKARHCPPGQAKKGRC